MLTGSRDEEITLAAAWRDEAANVRHHQRISMSSSEESNETSENVGGLIIMATRNDGILASAALA